MADQQRRRGRRAERAEVGAPADATPASVVAPGEPAEIADVSAVASERLCAGCRRTVPRDELMRLAIGPDAPYLAPDPQRRLGGRGVSVHPTRGCVTLAAKKGGFARALRRSVTIDVDALCEAAAVLYEKRAESLLLSAARRKNLAIGTDAVRLALRACAERASASAERASEERSSGPEEAREPRPVEALVVAADAEGRREELQAHAARLGSRCTVLGSKSSLGRLFGRDEVGVLGVLDRAIADEVVRCAAHANELRSPERKGERGHGGAPARVSEAE
jgi:predicted RNA-binding protein YlxR (DUF448 family)